MDAAKIVSKISKEHGIIKNVYFLACGGSLVDLYPGYYFVRAESAVMDAQWIPAREFALTPPKKLGKDSLLIICSHSGKTKECLEAAKVGMDAGAAVVTMTHAPGSPCDCEEWISVVYDWAPGVKEAQKPQGIVLDILNELMKAQEPGYTLYNSIKEGFEKIDDIIAEAVKNSRTQHGFLQKNIMRSQISILWHPVLPIHRHMDLQSVLCRRCSGWTADISIQQNISMDLLKLQMKIISIS